MTLTHSPVLINEVLEALYLKPGDIVIDATLGLGGHSRCILEHISPTGKLIAFEWDRRNREIAVNNLAQFSNYEVIPKSFSFLKESCTMARVNQAHAILFDLGISSAHLDDPSRGFSFRLEGPLDMRMDISRTTTAADIINFYSEQELITLFRNLGEEPASYHIATRIVARRKLQAFTDTADLYATIAAVCPRFAKKAAARIFQALRIAVNDELSELQSALPQAMDVLAPGGRLAVISFHSLEDRFVKNLFRDAEKNHSESKSWRRINKKVITPGEQELEENPRSRSAKLRIIEKLPQSDPQFI